MQVKYYLQVMYIIPEYFALDDTERAMLAVFRRMSPEKQLALLSLFK